MVIDAKRAQMAQIFASGDACSLVDPDSGVSEYRMAPRNVNTDTFGQL